MTLDRGSQDYDPLTRVRMERDALKKRNHELEVEAGRLRAECDDLQRKLDVAWALAATWGGMERLQIAARVKE